MYYTVGWKDEASVIQLPQLTEVPGPTITVSQSLLEMFSQFFSDDIIQLIVRETNRCHQQTARTTQFETNEEIRAYFGFMVLIGSISYLR